MTDASSTNSDKAQTPASQVSEDNNEASGAGARTDTSKVLEDLGRSNSARPASLKRRSSGLRRFLIILVLLIPLLIALAWLIYQQFALRDSLVQLGADNAELQSALQNLPATSPTTQIQGVDEQALAALRSNLEARINAVASSTASLQERVAAVPQDRANADWLWTESEYLLRLANQKLQLEGDRDSALLLLNTVDAMLSESGDPSLLGVRERISREVLALRSMEPVDTEGLYLRLNNLLPFVEQLSMRNALEQNYNDQLQQQRVSTAQPDSGFVARTLDLLGAIFVWQHRDETVAALLPPQEETVLKQNLLLLIQQAQLGLLMEQDVVYRSSLARGAEWMKRYFAIDSGAGRTLRDELDSLGAVSIRQQRPDISGSLELLKQISNSRNDAFGIDDN